MAVKLGHRLAISWDGADGSVIRQCASVSHLDGIKIGRVGGTRDSNLVVKAGWALLPAAKHCAPSSSADDNLDAVPRVGKKEKEKKQKKNSRHMRNKHGWQVGGDVDAAEPDVCVMGGDNVTESAVELPVVLCDHCVTTGDDIHPTMDWKTRADTGSFHPDNDEQKHRNVHSNRTVICWLQAGDMDVGGRYTIPKKTRVASGDK